MKLKRLISLAVITTALMLFYGGSLYAVNAISVGNSQAFVGGQDTVDVYVTTDSSFIGIEVNLAYDPAKFDYQANSVIVNPAAVNATEWTIVDQEDSVAGSVKVVFLASGGVNVALAPQSQPLKLFSVVLGVKAGAAAGAAMVTPSGLLTDNRAGEITPTSLTPGTFTIQSNYSLSLENVGASPGIAVPVDVSLANLNTVGGVSFSIRYNSAQLEFADSVVVDQALWQGGTPEAPEIDDSTGVVKIAIYTVSTGGIPGSSTERSIAQVFFRPRTNALATVTNALDLSDAVLTLPPTATEIIPSMTDGNIAITGKHSLRVSRDAAASAGGSDTVKVYLKNAESVGAVEATLKVSAANFNFTQGDVIFNGELFTGNAVTDPIITVTDSTIRIAAFPQGSLDSIPASDNERLLFSVVLDVDAAAVGGYDSLLISGIVSIRDAEFTPTDVTVGDLTKGVFYIRSPYELQVENAVARPQTTKTVNILLTNEQAMGSLQMTVRFETDSLSFVSGSVQVDPTVWSGPAPTVEAGPDSVYIALYDIEAPLAEIAANSSGRRLLSLNFTLNNALVVGSSPVINASGIGSIAGVGTEVAVTGVAGNILVANDVTPPSPVSNVTAQAEGNTIVVNWNNPGDADLARVTIDRVVNGVRGNVYNQVATANAAQSFVDQDVTAGVIYQYILKALDQAGNASDSVAVTASVGPGNLLEVESDSIAAGNMITISIYATSSTANIAGAAFTVNFDSSIVKVASVVAGSGAAGLAPQVVDTAAANASGHLQVAMLDQSMSNPAAAGQRIELARIVFLVPDGLALGTVVPLTLSNVSLSDPDGADIEVTSVNGQIVVREARIKSRDVNNDGIVSIVDLFAYLQSPLDVPADTLAALIAELLSQPLPATMLASAQEMAMSDITGTGAAKISLNPEFEIFLAQFIFSHDRSYELETVQVNSALSGKVLINRFYRDGKLVIDLICLSGMNPEELGQEVLSLQFKNADWEQVRLTLDEVRVADRSGKVYLAKSALVGAASMLPKAFSLSQNSPNPFNPSTTIAYTVPEGNDGLRVKLEVFNLRGQKIVTLVDELKEAGNFTVSWDGRGANGSKVSSGVYFYRMQAGDFSAVRKMVVLK